MKLLLDILVEDLVQLMSKDINGAPLEFPIFGMILKGFILQLIEIA